MSTKNLYINVHISIILTAKKWKLPKYSSTDKQIKIWYIHTMESYLAIKCNAVLIHTATWVNPDNIMLSERSNHKGHILYGSIYKKCLGKANLQGLKLVVSKEWREGEWA